MRCGTQCSTTRLSSCTRALAATLPQISNLSICSLPHTLPQGRSYPSGCRVRYLLRIIPVNIGFGGTISPVSQYMRDTTVNAGFVPHASVSDFTTATFVAGHPSPDNVFMCALVVRQRSRKCSDGQATYVPSRPRSLIQVNERHDLYPRVNSFS